MNALAASDSPAPAPPEVCRPDVLDTLANAWRAPGWSAPISDRLLPLKAPSAARAETSRTRERQRVGSGVRARAASP